MEWSKIKNIIILLLLTVNMFLLALTANQELRSKQYRQEARTGAVEVLREQGITIDSDSLPIESTLAWHTAERDRESERAMAEALLGVVVRADDGGRVTYAGNGGEAWFRSNGSFSVTFSTDLWSTGGEDEGAYSTKVLSEAGFSCELVSLSRGIRTDREAGAAAELETTRVTVSQVWEGTPLFTCQAVLRYENGVLKSVEGQRLTGTPLVSSKREAQLDVATVLIRFLGGMREGGHVFTRMDSLRPGYRTTTSPGGATELEPIWQANTDGGIFYLDGATGLLSQ